jgi:hypothetical protein
MQRARSRTALVVAEGSPADLAAVDPDGFVALETPFDSVKVMVHDPSAVATHQDAGTWVVVVGDPMGDRAGLARALAGRFDPQAPGLGLRASAASLMDGHCAAVVVHRDGCWAVSDHMGGLPLFRADPAGAALRSCCGTDLNAVAEVTGRLAADHLSLHEFLRSGKVTFPSTAFQDIRRLEPGAISRVAGGGPAGPQRSTFVRYWEPRADLGLDNDGAREVMEAARDVMHDNVTRIVEQYEQVTLLFSGGSDSRVLAAMLRRAAVRADRANVDAVIFLDRANLEYRRASRAARALRLPLSLLLRGADHSTSRVHELVSQCGVGFDVRHAHAAGLVSPVSGGVFIDGWLADTLLKNLTASRQPLSAAAGPDAEAAELLEQIDVRREARRAAVAEVRGAASEAAWADLWPLTAVEHVVNRIGTQGIGASLSPFALGSFVRTVAPIGEGRKRSGRLFLEVFARDMGPARWLPASGGIVPAMPASVNARLRALTRVRLDVIRRSRARAGLSVPVEGSWPSKAQLMAESARALALTDEGPRMQAMELTGYRALPKLGKHHDQRLLQVTAALAQGLIRP